MSLLSREALETALRDKPTVDVDVPGLGAVRIRTLSGLEREKFEMESYEEHKAGSRNYRARLVALCLVDENGKPIFNELDAKHILSNGNAVVLDRIYAAAKKHNRLDPVDDEADLKNSANGGSSDSGSSSPDTSAKA